MGSCRDEIKTTQHPTRWEREADVVVVGYGGAGAVSAITASEAGGTVAVLEKAPEPGGNTRTATGGMRVPEDAEKTAEYIKAVSLGSVDDETAAAYSAIWIAMVPWLKQRGARLISSERIPRWNLPGVDAFHTMLHPESEEGYKIGSGKDLFAFLDKTTRKRGAEVMLSTPAKRLIQNPHTKEILGVIAENHGKEILIKAKKAVIMTCGGFEGNREMLTTYIGELPAPIHVSGTPYNTGDGINMVLDVGADLWHMSGIEWGRQGLKVPDHPAAFWISPMGWSWINVNRYGKRFRNEGDSYGHAKRYLEIFQFDSDRIEWPNYPWYMIFDDRTRKAGPMINREKELDRSPFITYNISFGLYMPSPDNRKEIEKGWIKQANTIAELATKAGIDKTGLEGTVARYNRYCKNRKGSAPDFYRTPETLEPIDTPPYYAIECTITIINTQGGPRRNAKGQVLSPYGTPIPRLYAGGEFGSIWGFLYPGACNLPECIISGMIAGRNAVAEAPWK